MATQATEFRVNDNPLYNQEKPAATTLADGTVVMVWTDVNAEGYGTLSWAHFDAQGNKLGGAGFIAGFVSPFEPASIDALATGGFAVSWASADGDIEVKSYTANFIPVGDATANTSTTIPVQHQDNAAITGLADGGFLVTWRSDIDNSTGYESVLAQRYAANGAQVGGEMIVESIDHVPLGNSVVTSLLSGGWVIAWNHGGEIEQRRYDAGGQPAGTGAPQVVADPGSASGYDTAGIAALADGGWVVMYEGAGQTLYSQRYDAAGTAIGGATQVAQGVINTYEELPAITGLKSGGWVATWETLAPGNTGDIHAQIFAANGERVGSEITVNSYTDSGQASPTVTALQDGGFLVGWESYGEDGSGSGIYATRFDANGVPQSNPDWLDGTAGNDTIQHSGANNERITGLGGDDTLAGGSGNDTIDGGAGNDVIQVSNGTDVLTGGTGVDTAAFNMPTSQLSMLGYSQPGSYTAYTAQGQSFLGEIERAQFSDGLFALDTQAPVMYNWPGGNTWWAANLFDLAFGQLPGIEELSRWTAQADQSASPGALAQQMIDTYAPGVSNHDLVAYLYQQIAGVAPTEDQIAYYTRMIAPAPQPQGGSMPWFSTQGDFVQYVGVSFSRPEMFDFTGKVHQLDPGWF